MALQTSAKDQLRTIVARIERLEEEKAALSADLKEVYLEAKGNGFDVKALRTVMREESALHAITLHGSHTDAASGEAVAAKPSKDPAPVIDEATRTELEAAAFRRFLAHLRARSDVENIDLMELAGFCRNCLSGWYQEAAAAKGLALGKEEAREIVYGMAYEAWKAKFQSEPKRKASKTAG